MVVMETQLEAVTRAICAERCAFYGEPPCWQVAPEKFALTDCDDVGCRAMANAAIRADLAQAPAPVRVEHSAPREWWINAKKDGQMERAHRSWEDADHGRRNWQGRVGDDHEAIVHVREVLPALEAPDAGVVAELVEAVREVIAAEDDQDAASGERVTSAWSAMVAALAKWDAK
jgi:hypothetical protein